jgi:hypothetical protein
MNETLAHNIGVGIALVACLYFGFKYGNPITLIGAFIAFWCIK